jgi:toxin FitB
VLLLDTNVVSELCRRQPDAGVLAWSAGTAGHAISAVTVDEIVYGLTRRTNSRIESWFDGFLQRHPVLPVTVDVARRAGQLRGAFAARGIVRSQPDMLIATS